MQRVEEEMKKVDTSANQKSGREGSDREKKRKMKKVVEKRRRQTLLPTKKSEIESI